MSRMTSDPVLPNHKRSFKKFFKAAILAFLLRFEDSCEFFSQHFWINLFAAGAGYCLKISPVARSISTTLNKGWLPFASVIIECSSQWIGIPDVRFEKIAEPITNIDYGGGTDPPKFPKRFSDCLDETAIDTTSFKFVFQDGQHLIDQWEGAQVQNELFIEIPQGSILTGIREGFVSLLDYAEETLKAKTVVICVPKTMQRREEVLKAFAFMGFHIINPSHVKYIKEREHHVFMGYEIE